MKREFDVKNIKSLKMRSRRCLGKTKFLIRKHDSQAKLFRPITDVNTILTSNLEKTIADQNQNYTNALMPLVQEMQRSNEQYQSNIKAIRDLSGLTDVFDEQAGAASTPASTKTFNLDKDFDAEDFENLRDLSFEKPSKLYSSLDTISRILELVKSKTKSLAQEFRADRIAKKSDKEKVIYDSQKHTLEKYKARLKYILESKSVTGEGMKRKQKRKIVKRKCGRGRPKTNHTIIYNDADDLTNKLYECVVAYRAGNNALYNPIVDMLDELLDKKVISKKEYDVLSVNIL